MCHMLNRYIDKYTLHCKPIRYDNQKRYLDKMYER